MTQAYAPAGTDFAVNVEYVGKQHAARIAPLAAGGFVVVWQQDFGGLPSRLVARIYDANGDEASGELTLKIDAPGQPGPAVGLTSGNFLVTSDDLNFGVAGSDHGRIYDPQGNPLGAEFPVLATGVAALPDGGFVAAWTEFDWDPSRTAIKAQLYDGSGTKVGDELQVSAPTDQDLGSASVASLAGGGFVVTWKDFTGGHGTDPAVWVQAQVFDAAGAKVGGVVSVAGLYATLAAVEPAVTGLASGNYVAAWYEVHATLGQGFDVFAQIMTPGGVKVGGPILVDTVTSGAQLRAALTALPDGGFAVAWDDASSDPSGIEFVTKIQVFDSAGTKVGAELPMNPGGANPEQTARIAALADGRLVVTWTDHDPAFDYDQGGVRAQVLAVEQLGDASGDVFVGTAVNDAFAGLGGSDTFDMSQGGNDTVLGGEGDDTFDFGAAFSTRDRVDGGAGFDTLFLDGPYYPGGIYESPPLHDLALAGLERIVVAPGNNYELRLTDAHVAAGQVLEVDSSALAYLEVLALYGGDELDGAFHGIGGEGQEYFQGGAGNDIFHGGNSNDSLDGGAGDDVLDGGEGFDYLGYVDVLHGVTVDLSLEVAQDTGWGLDLILGFEAVVSSHFDDVLTGTSRDESFVTRGGYNIVHAMGGNDEITGDYGSGLFDGGEGIDTLQYLYDPSSIAIDLSVSGPQVIAPGYAVTLVSIENMLGTIEGDDLLIGNSADNLLNGLGGNNRLLGQGGDDALVGWDEQDVLDGGDGHDALTGGDGNDWLYGGAGHDQLEGGPGNDVLDGGAGDDSYFVDSAADQVIEAAGNGVDRVSARISYELAPDAEVEVLVSDYAVNLTGNGFANAIYGSIDANVLAGGGGGDYVVGWSGDDTLYGGDGNDALDGGVGNDVLLGGDGADYLAAGEGDDLLRGDAGIDTLVGGFGDDTYYIDGPGDLIVESDSVGFDRVVTTASFELDAAAQVEVVQFADLAATSALSLYGSDIANSIYGNAGGNVLAGLGGGDYLVGLGGHDTLYGGAGVDAIDGGAGSDVLFGGTGADYLVGGADGDYFAFFDPLGGGNVDQVADFAAGTDLIALDDAVFTGLAAGALAAGAFVAGTAAADADDRVIHDAASGQLWFDADGNGAGAAVLFATVGPGLTLTSADFVVF